ncbi:superoxide dismutase family protein [Piscinibacter sakaiensis]|uniref:Superoxide dismutase [Cu-Zn] n=1 Tax=Piscinibacter sakaiensis TaxID=1547922 RepID=A0A0K8NYA5_PISS1|nr:superoxide dismutase family protein [Piscinibacter sakaiensis]GAP35387.1 superoxide dismutase [Cu-Zn] precursor [Piscinibacter sakaiensis]
MTSPRRFALPAAALLGVALCGCAAVSTGPTATATLEARSNSRVAGSVSFAQVGDGVRVAVRASGLKPNAEHGFHVHEKGDCSSPDGMSTGGHFNPTGQPHGPQHAAHHAGDMPGPKADADGKVDTSFTLAGVTLSPGPSSLMGRGVIVHADPDDYRTQPTGNSGARIACGVIR